MGKKQNKFLRHEALHTAYVMTCMWGDHVVESKFVKNDEKLKELAIKASDAMCDLYQAMGRSN